MRPDGAPEYRTCRALRLLLPAFQQPGGRARGPLVPLASRRARAANVFYSVPRAFLRLSQPSPPQVRRPGEPESGLGASGTCATMRFPELRVKRLFALVTRNIARTRR